MLAEFFLTPDVFLGSAEDLNRLRECLFPINGNHVPVICQFDKERWETYLGHKIARIQQDRQRKLAMELFKRICDELAVYRPSVNGAPKCESDWINAARNSARVLALDDIVVSRVTVECPADCHRVSEFTGAGYWQQFGNPRLVGRDRQAQAAVLRTICAHAHWLIVRMPQVRGGFDDEVVTIKQIIQLANNLPEDFPRSDIFIEIPNSAAMEKEFGKLDAAKRLLRSVKAELREFRDTGGEVSIAVYPSKSVLDREVLAGEYVTGAKTSKEFKARWYLTMSHVAVGGRESSDAHGGNSWSLHPRSIAASRLEELAGQVPVIPPEVI